jgi:acyl-CoA reductase-like NAD-dependent aldehyde dehydrogenase
VSVPTGAALRAAIDAALEARARARTQSVARRARALAAAARRWQDDPGLHARLPAASGLSPAMVAVTVPLVAGAFDVEAMERMVRDEVGEMPPDAPPLVAHVLASNVPALALPAIAHAVLLGSAVVVKSGRADPVSAPAFARALADVDADLGATVVAVTWPGGTSALDQILLQVASVLVLTGADETIAAVAPRAAGRVLRHGTRFSVALVDDSTDADALAEDVVLYEQRGCLSPQAVWVRGDAHAFATRLGEALARVAVRLPPPAAATGERAAVRAFLDDAAWSGAEVRSGPWGATVVRDLPRFLPTCGRRTVHVAAIDAATSLAERLPAGRIECVGVSGEAPVGLESIGVSRLCPVGRMQRPPLAWPRGARAPLASLLGRPSPVSRRLLVES